MPQFPMPPFFGPTEFLTGAVSGLLFTIIAFVFCLLIYLRTKESYELTRHKGILYFRNAFLFLGLSYLLRFIFDLAHLSRFIFDFILPREVFVPLFILPLSYLSTMGIFYLLFSISWKRFDSRYMELMSHLFALALALASIITGSPFVLLILQCTLLLIVVAMSLAMHIAGRVSKVKLLYLLVALLWLINLLVIDRGRPHFPFAVELVFQLASLAVFAVLYSRITKWIR
jgi:hypothetical protein